MNEYKSYMDRVNVSDAFHQKLLDLQPRKKPSRPAWTKYAAVAACAALLIGVGAWGVSQDRDGPSGGYGPSVDIVPGADVEPVPCAAPSAPVQSQETIDLAPEDPNGVEPGMKAIEGYETRENRAGVDVAVYHVLPWIDYGSDNEAAAAALDWDLPAGAARRDLNGSEIVTLLGGADAVDLHLDWSSYELTGWAAWYEDGSFWGAYLMGYKGPMDHFEFAVTRGHMPPTCIVFGGSVEQEVWGLTVTADKYDGENGCARRVSFMKDNYGYRFDLTATGEPEDAERLVSRAVTWVANGKGLDLSAVGPDGAVIPSQAPDFSVGEPNWNDAEPATGSVPPQDGSSAPSVPPAAPSPSRVP